MKRLIQGVPRVVASQLRRRQRCVDYLVTIPIMREDNACPPISNRDPSGVTSVQARPSGSAAWLIRSQSDLPC